MFGANRGRRDAAVLDGVITFFGSYHALRAESLLKKAGLAVRLIPGPRDISPNCGVALRMPYERREEACTLLQDGKVQFEAVHFYPEGKAATEKSR